jgi:hypothetical protein
MFLLLLYLFTKGYCLCLALQKGGFYVAKTMFLRTKKGVFASQKGVFAECFVTFLLTDNYILVFGTMFLTTLPLCFAIV